MGTWSLPLLASSTRLFAAETVPLSPVLPFTQVAVPLPVATKFPFVRAVTESVTDQGTDQCPRLAVIKEHGLPQLRAPPTTTMLPLLSVTVGSTRNTRSGVVRGGI